MTELRSQLHGAAWSGDLEQVKHVVTAGADVNGGGVGGGVVLSWSDPNLQNQDGVTPLHWAASHGNVDTIRALVEAGADPTVPDKRNRLPIDAAHEHGKGAHVAVLKTVGPPIASRRKPK
ncbi:MAG: ankyrin repeat domain-containing protein [Candidatus Competibacteraceae bacterium]|nr:ankyrin repeat domain-containing protein [Candidatus Competibacteraceae bacterium]